MKEFVVIFEEADDNYSASVPDLPGCIAAGNTLEETEILIKEAIDLYIETLKQDNQTIPEPSTQAKPVSISI